MFTNNVFCTSKLLADVFLDDERNPKQKYVLIKKLWNESISFFIDESDCLNDEKEFYKSIIDEYYNIKVLQSYDSTRVDFTLNNISFLTKEKSNKRSSDVFIIMADKDYCDLLTKEYGVFVTSQDNFLNLETLFYKKEIRITKGDTYSKKNSKTTEGWDSMFFEITENKEYHMPPINSIIISDCYLFSLKQERGISNITSLIKGLLVNNKINQSQISIFTLNDKGKQQFYFEEILEKLKNEFPDSEIEIFTHNKKLDLHARIIVTNYCFIEDPQGTGFDLFESDKARINGSLNIKNLYSDLNTMISSQKLTVIQDIKKYINIFKEIKNNIIENVKRPEIRNPKPGDIIRIEKDFYLTTTEKSQDGFTNRLLL